MVKCGQECGMWSNIHNWSSNFLHPLRSVFWLCQIHPTGSWKLYAFICAKEGICMTNQKKECRVMSAHHNCSSNFLPALCLKTIQYLFDLGNHICWAVVVAAFLSVGSFEFWQVWNLWEQSWVPPWSPDSIPHHKPLWTTINHYEQAHKLVRCNSNSYRNLKLSSTQSVSGAHWLTDPLTWQGCYRI